MKHDEFQVKGHRFGNEVRALLRVNLRGAFLRCISKRRRGASDDSALESYIPAVSFCKTANLILEENIMGKSYKPIQV